jgi:tetratricopeptide (TPR) repeat protein
VKRLLLEELGTYLESETEVKNFQLTRDQITTLTAGIVQTEIIEEKWDGRLYWLKSKITADSDKVVQSINELRKDRQKTLELESMRKKSDELLKENERLRKELTAAKGGNRETQKAAYDKSIKELSSMEWLEKGHAASDHKEAIKAYSQAIELDPQNARAYYFRARSSDKNLAIQDYNKLLEIEPKDSEAYLLRAWTYKELKEDDLAIKEFGKAIETATGTKEKANAYHDRGRYYTMHDKNFGLQDFSRAIELDQNNELYYLDRGVSYQGIGRMDRALLDFNKAIEIDPKNDVAYFARGHLVMDNKPELAIADLSRAIELAPNSLLVTVNYMSRAQVYEKLGKFYLAIQEIHLSIPHGPTCISWLASTTWQSRITTKPSNWRPKMDMVIMNAPKCMH